MALCAACSNRTGWGIKVKDQHGKSTIEICRHCCFCDACHHPKHPSELQDVPHYICGPNGDRDDELHLSCDRCRQGLCRGAGFASNDCRKDKT